MLNLHIAPFVVFIFCSCGLAFDAQWLFGEKNGGTAARLELLYDAGRSRRCNEADRVYGVLFRIATAEAADLDDHEGLGHGYCKGEVEAIAATARTRAKAYFATEKDPARLPYHWYKAFVVEGALEHQLPASYIGEIQAVVSQPDPNVRRRSMNEDLLLRRD